MLRPAEALVRQALGDYMRALLGPEELYFQAHSLFSARAVIAPGGEALRYDQVGLPDEIAWALFGPLLAAETQSSSATAPQASDTHALDRLMARSWVLINRAPSIAAHTFLALSLIHI